MKRRIKPIVINIATILILIFGILIMYDKIIEATAGKEVSKQNIKIENITLTELMFQTININNRGPKPRPKKIAYITIDDGPSKYTDKILDILNENNVKGTFFMIDKNMKSYPTSVKRMVEEGHSAGFHSVSHDINVLYNAPESTVGEFDKCKDTLMEITGSLSKIIRLPYGSKPYAPKESYDALIESGYKIWDWNLDTQDWKATKEELIENVEIYSNEHRELVLLMHEKEQSVEALQGMIDILKSKGYTILPIEENSYPKNYWEQNLTN